MTTVKTFKIHTLGCKVNQYDSQLIREQLQRLGLEELKNGKKADCYIINTCTVTRSADRQSRNLIRSAHKENPAACIIATGCYAHLNEESIREIEGVDFIVNNENKFSIGELLFPSGARGQCETIHQFDGHTRAFVKVQDGCNNFCSFCKVPYARGRSRSRTLDTVKREATFLASNAYKELVLSGICLGDYGKDFGSGIDIVDLIESLEKIDGIERIRLSSIEAQDISSRLIEKMSLSKKLCEHLHIPFQSGDDTILKAMNRRDTCSSYLELLSRLRRAIPDIGISTDIMIGFPGEGEKEFEHTLKFLENIEPMRVHIFTFTPRDYTPLFHKNISFSSSVIKERYQRIKKLCDSLGNNFMSRFIGCHLEVLFEERAKGFWRGYSRNYLPVIVREEERCSANELFQVVAKKIKNSFIEASLGTIYNIS